MTMKRSSKSRSPKAQRRLGMLTLAFVLALSISSVFERSAQAAPTVDAFQQIVACQDTYEPNEPLSGAWEIATGPLAFVDSYICPPQNGFGDEDWFKFNVPTAGKEIWVSLTDLPANYDIKLYDPSGVDVSASVNGGTANEWIQHVAPTTGYWAVHIYGPMGENNGFDPYTLQVTLNTPSGQCSDPYEPNDGFFTAWQINAGQPVSSFICSATDDDYFKFNVSSGQRIDVELSSLPADYDLYLYDPTGRNRRLSAAGGTTAEALDFQADMNGDWVIQVHPSNNDGDINDSYYLNVQVSGTPGGCLDNWEPNDNFNGAPVPFMSMPNRGRICSANDNDVFRIPTEQGRRHYEISLTDLPADYDLKLFDANEQQVAQSTNSGTADETVSFDASGIGHYYVQIYGYNGAFREDADYTMNVTITNPTYASCGEPFEPNDRALDAARITPSAQGFEGYVCHDQDYDWFVFTAQAGDRIIARLTSLPADYELAIHDPNGDPVGSSTNGGSQNEEVVITAAQGGDYQVVVWGFGGASDRNDTYNLVLNTETQGGTSPCGEFFEPNDTLADAHGLTAGMGQDGYICNEPDVDWFKIDATAGQELRATLSVPEDYDLELYDGSQTLLASSAGSGTATETINLSAPATGTYFFKVYGYQGAHSASATYSLTVDLGNAGSGCGEPFEPNESPSEAHVVKAGEGLVGFICEANDVDWFRIDAAGGQVLHAGLSVPVDYDLELYDSSQTLIKASAAGGTAMEVMSHTVTVDGSYYFKVFGYGGVFSRNDNYAFLVNVTNASSSCGEFFEPNESPADAHVLSESVGQAGYICDAADVDWFQIDATSGQELRAVLSVPLDYDLQLFDSSQTLLAESAAGGNATETVTYNVSQDGSYYLKVFGYGGVSSSSETYSITAYLSAGQPQGCGEWFEPNEDFSVAAGLRPGEPTAGIICDASDVDWFSFPAARGQGIIATLKRLPQDYDLRLYDPAGSLVEDPQVRGTGEERIEHTAAMAGDYRLLVIGFNGAAAPGLDDFYLVQVDVRNPNTTPTETPTPTSTQAPSATPTHPPKPSATPTATSTTAPPKPSATATAIKPTATQPGGGNATATPTAAELPTKTAVPTKIPPSATPTSTDVPAKPSPTTTSAPVEPSATPVDPVNPSATPVDPIDPTATPSTGDPVFQLYIPFAYQRR